MQYRENRVDAFKYVNTHTHTKGDYTHDANIWDRQYGGRKENHIHIHTEIRMKQLSSCEASKPIIGNARCQIERKMTHTQH